jgi:hypothetical protein
MDNTINNIPTSVGELSEVAVGDGGGPPPLIGRYEKRRASWNSSHHVFANVGQPWNQEVTKATAEPHNTHPNGVGSDASRFKPDHPVVPC